MIPARNFTDPLPLLVTFVLLSLSACASLSGVFSGNSAGVHPPVSQGLFQSGEERVPAAQLSLSLKETQGNHRVVPFAGAAAQVGSDRLGAIGMTGLQENDKTKIFQVDCRRAR